MSTLRTDLQQIPVPAVPMDEILRRGRALQRRKTMAVTFAAVMSIAVAAVSVQAWRMSSTQSSLKSNTGPAAPAESDPEIEVFLLDNITAQERRNIRSIARDLDGVSSVRYISKKVAFRDFKNMYRDEPEYWENLSRNALPAYFIIVLENVSYIEDARDAIESRPGVDEVMWRPNQNARP